jgi:hypothetical protein
MAEFNFVPFYIPRMPTWANPSGLGNVVAVELTPHAEQFLNNTRVFFDDGVRATAKNTVVLHARMEATVFEAGRVAGSHYKNADKPQLRIALAGFIKKQRKMIDGAAQTMLRMKVSKTRVEAFVKASKLGLETLSQGFKAGASLKSLALMIVSASGILTLATFSPKNTDNQGV